MTREIPRTTSAPGRLLCATGNAETRRMLGGKCAPTDEE